MAQWHFDEWGHHYPGGTVDGWLDHIRTRMNADQIPMTVVALDDGEPIGTAALVEHDMETHRELSPWLGGVYVVPSARGRGVARALLRDVIDRAAAFGIPVLYLYTNGAEGLYQKLDWKGRLAADPDEFLAALGLYLGDGTSESYRPGGAIDGARRVREAFASRAEGLIAEVETLLRTARSLPGLWGEHALPLEEACERIERFLQVEYAIIPATLRRRIVDPLSYELWK